MLHRSDALFHHVAEPALMRVEQPQPQSVGREREADDHGNRFAPPAHRRSEHDLGGLDLSGQPTYDPAVFPDGVNIEFVTQPRKEKVSR